MLEECAAGVCRYAPGPRNTTSLSHLSLPRMYSNRTAQKWASLSEHHIPLNKTLWLFKFVCIF